jgi:hypothetical protein
MPRRYRYPEQIPVVQVPRRRKPEPPTVSIAELHAARHSLRWTFRLVALRQLVELVSKVPRKNRRQVAILAGSALLLVAALVAAYWPYLLAAGVLYLAVRFGRRELRRRAELRRERAENPLFDPEV